MSRHREIQFSKSKAILVAAGALSVASATATTWTTGSSGHAGATAGQAYAASAHEASGVLRLTFTDRLGRPQAEVAAYQRSVSLAQRTYQLRAGQARDAAPRQTGTVIVTAASGSPRQIAAAMLRPFGWSSSQFSCLDPLWAHESGWRVAAYNASSGAFGIPQALPGSRMASAGPAWHTNAATQIRWGLQYIKGTYRSPCAAWGHEEATGWY